EIRNIGAPLAPPSAPTNPSPSNHAGGVSPNSSLTWTAAGATSYDIAFGTQNPPLLVATTSTASYTPALTANTQYYWQVTARNNLGTAVGPVWSFFTGTGPLPSIPSSPSPASGATAVPNNAVLTWSASGAT